MPRIFTVKERTFYPPRYICARMGAGTDDWSIYIEGDDATHLMLKSILFDKTVKEVYKLLYNARKTQKHHIVMSSVINIIRVCQLDQNFSLHTFYSRDKINIL